MTPEEFWTIVEGARSHPEPTHAALINQLAARSLEDILDFQERFDELEALVKRWDVWAAAYLIGGGCSDDAFSVFRAGLIALGHDWFERAVRLPDALADHPAVTGTIEELDRPIFYEAFQFAASSAYERRSGDGDAFWEALQAREEAAEAIGHDMGEDFDFDDSAEMHRCLPRLASLFLPTG
ncbi:DUF4240 domain-containing protein [Actinomadura napierensis]|uniref:DUF4240 domain-containing protein n=1 Tax=Actinomadura napierensis TaxID=267854 RepID=A0ABP5LL77_9ACTN